MQRSLILTACETDANLGDYKCQSSQGLNMVTYLGVKLKPSVRCEDHDRWRAKWVFCRQQDTEVVQSSFEFGSTWATESAMPFLQIRIGQRHRISRPRYAHKDIVLTVPTKIRPQQLVSKTCVLEAGIPREVQQNNQCRDRLPILLLLA